MNRGGDADFQRPMRAIFSRMFSFLIVISPECLPLW
jgi:hypothetical protein